MNIKLKINSEIKKEETIRRLKKCLFDGMLKMQELAILHCPVDKGILAGSIHLEPMMPEESLYTLWARANYATAIEFGTSAMIAAHGPHDPKNPVTRWKAKTDRGGGPEQTMPFFRPALDEVKNVWIKRYWERAI